MMIKKVLFIFFTILSLQAHCGKLYTLDFRTYSLDKGEPLEGILVVLSSFGGEADSMYTDAEGRVIFTDFKAWKRRCIVRVVDQNELYQSKNVFVEFDRWKREENRTIYLPLSKEVLDTRKQEVIERYEKRTAEHPLDSTILSWSGDSCDEEDFVDAAFKGGPAAMQRYINDNIAYPQESIEKGEQGRVYLKFVVEKDGYITHIEVERGVSHALDEESKWVVMNMPAWEPATCNGEPVRYRARLPIIYSLQ